MKELSLISLVLEAGLIVQLVMLILLLASIWSWSIIIYKLRMFKAYQRDLVDFKEKFISTKNLSLLYKEIEQYYGLGMRLIFAAGFKEYVRLKNKNFTREEILSGADRAMRVIISREIEKLEKSLPFLATVGSTSPYIGLFGTVIGIMNSFHSLSFAKNVSIAMVAPGISEALIATAMGLFAAIPGVIFYNRFVTETNVLLKKYETFQEEFITVLQRQ